MSLNAPIDADTNLAKPSEVIAASAVLILLPAGENILFTLKSASIIASAPILSKSFFGSKWNNDELISIFASLPLMNCMFSLPIKNASVLMSSSAGYVINLK